jgi:hypothetical protein
MPMDQKCGCEVETRTGFDSLHPSPAGENAELRDDRELLEGMLIYTRAVLDFSLLICRAAIFESSVWRGAPSFVAAPECPETRPWISASAASRYVQHPLTYQFYFPAIPIFRKTPALCSQHRFRLPEWILRLM